MVATSYTINLACLVDDDNSYTYSAKRILKDSPIFKDYVIFNDGHEAIDYFKSVVGEEAKIPDVLFLDVNMPVMDGWDFLEEFAHLKPNLHKNVTIYLISSSIDPRDIERANAISDVSQYIIKPINIEQFEKIFKYFDIEAA